MQKSFLNKKENDETRLITQISSHTKLISDCNDLKRYKNKQPCVLNKNYKVNLLSVIKQWDKQQQVQKSEQNDEVHQYEDQSQLPKPTNIMNFKQVYRHQVDRINQDIIVNQYTLSKVLGKGAQGIVKLGSDTKKFYAVKIINCQKLKKKFFITKDQLEEMISVEVKILKKLDHPNIIKLYEALYSEESEKLFLILEYCSKGTLTTLINSKQIPLQSEWSQMVKKMFTEMASALEYLYQKSVAHRDIKAENILINQSNNAKICDFNVSTFYKKNQLESNTNFVGTKLYASPELLLSKKKQIRFDPFSADIWAFGITFYELFQRKHPFASKTLAELEQIVQNKIVVTQNIPKGFQDLLIKMLELDWKNRIRIKQILKHEWLQIT